MSREHLSGLRPTDNANRGNGPLDTHLSDNPQVREYIKRFGELLASMGLTQLPEGPHPTNPRHAARLAHTAGQTADSFAAPGTDGQRVAAGTFAPRQTGDATPRTDAPVQPGRRLETAAAQPETLEHMRERVMGFTPKEVDKYFERHSNRTLGTDYTEQRQRFLDRYKAEGREGEALRALDALQSRLQPDAANPLDFKRATSMLQVLNDAGSKPENQLCPLMDQNGRTRHQMVMDRSLEFINNVAHCQGNDTTIFQHIGSCGVMGTVRDGCDKAPDEMARVLAAGWTATTVAGRDSQGRPTRYMGDFVNSNGTHNNFYVNSSYMNDVPGGSDGEQAMMQLHASLTNIMWTPEGCEYRLGPATGHGETGAQLTRLSDGRVIGDTPCTTLEATNRLDQRMAMGTVRVFSEPGVDFGPNSNMINVYGLPEAQARERIQQALAQGGGTVQMIGNGAILLGLANAGRDSYHNTSLSYDPRNGGRYILTDTNRGLSDDNYGAMVNGRTDALGLALAGLNGDNNEYARAYRLSHPGRGRGVHMPDGADPERDFHNGMKKPDEVKLTKDDDSHHRRSNQTEDELYAMTQRKQQATATIDQLRQAWLANQAQGNQGELHISEQLMADANIDLGQFMV
jgi:hypothetical protein